MLMLIENWRLYYWIVVLRVHSKDSQNGPNASGFLVSFVSGGMSGAVAKTVTAPIDRMKLKSFSRQYRELGLAAFSRGNLTNVIRYFSMQAFNFAFKDQFSGLLPKYNAKTEFSMFFLTKIASDGLAGAASFCIIYPLDYARFLLVSDVGKDQKSFNCLADCIVKTVCGPSGTMGLYNGFTVPIFGVVLYRSVYFGMYDSLNGSNPFMNESGLRRLASKYIFAQATAIAAGCYTSYPFDIIRRRLQIQ
jgi:solute carrier family 25 (mitochondrial adenine nucleotide translocator), member 4/5/6/31